MSSSTGEKATSLAAEFSISLRKMKLVLQKTLDSGLATDSITSTDLVRLIKAFDKKDKQSIMVPKKVAEFLRDQYAEKEKLTTIAEIAREYLVSNVSLKNYIYESKWGGVKTYLSNHLLKENVFLQGRGRGVVTERAHELMITYFEFLAAQSCEESAILKNAQGKQERFYVLQEIKDGNARKGRIVGFATDCKGVKRAIVAFEQSKSMKFGMRLRPFNPQQIDVEVPELENDKELIEIHLSTAEIINSASKNSTNDRYYQRSRYYLNILLDTLLQRIAKQNTLMRKKQHSYRVEKVFDGSDLKLIIYTTSFRINIADFFTQEPMLKKTMHDLQACYGELIGEKLDPKIVTGLGGYLDDHLVGVTESKIENMFLGKIAVTGCAKALTLYMPEDYITGLKEAAFQRDISPSDLVVQLFQLIGYGFSDDKIVKVAGAVSDYYLESVAHDPRLSGDSFEKLGEEQPDDDDEFSDPVADNNPLATDDSNRSVPSSGEEIVGQATASKRLASGATTAITVEGVLAHA